MTALWLVVMAVSGVASWFTLFGLKIRTPTEESNSWVQRDDADAVAVRFGAADDDRVIGVDSSDPLTGTRVMTYTKRGLRVVLVRRARGSPPRLVWKLVGFTEPDEKAVLTGEEALRRLKRDR